MKPLSSSKNYQMDSPFLPSPSHGHRVFRGACGVLALIALAQGMAVAMAWKGPSASPVTQLPQNTVQSIPSSPGSARDSDPFAPGAPGLADPHPELALPPGEEPTAGEAGLVTARPPVVLAAPLDVPITDEACLVSLDEGIYRRDRGDMAGAVVELRKALERIPDHPKLLYHLASALDSLGQEGKATVHWRNLRLLGQGAGNFYHLAAARLKEGGNLTAPEEAQTQTKVSDAERKFRIRQVDVAAPVTARDGEVLRFEVTTQRLQPEAADVAQLEIRVHLFDEVNGQRIDRTTALPPAIEWLDAPVDWADGTERFTFEYRQPPFTPDEVLKLGRRKFYGYAIQVGYGSGQLQDVAADPPILADLAQEIPESVPGTENSPTSPPDGLSPGSGQPSSDLFPGDRLER